MKKTMKNPLSDKYSEKDNLGLIDKKEAVFS